MVNKSVGKHLKSVGGRRLKHSVELACMNMVGLPINNNQAQSLPLQRET
jgi:hypothetical protein